MLAKFSLPINRAQVRNGNHDHGHSLITDSNQNPAIANAVSLKPSKMRALQRVPNQASIF